MDFNSDPLEEPGTGRFSDYLEPTNYSRIIGVFGSLKDSGSFELEKFLVNKALVQLDRQGLDSNFPRLTQQEL